MTFFGAGAAGSAPSTACTGSGWAGCSGFAAAFFCATARRAVELACGLGASDAQSRMAIAAELGLHENGVKTLMQRVRQQLRACVERRQP